MLKFALILFLLIAALLDFGCGTDSKSEGGCDAAVSTTGYLASKDCRLLSWGNQLPITIVTENTVPKELVTTLNESANVWENATQIDLFKIETQSVQPQNLSDLRFNLFGIRGGQSWLTAPIEGKVTEPAKTVYFYREFLYNTNIFLNEDFVMDTKDHYDFQTIITHELGHVLGLDHDNSESPQISIMNSKIKPREKRSLTERDIFRVRFLYRPF